MNTLIQFKYLLVLFGTMQNPLNIPEERVFDTEAQCETAFSKIRLGPKDSVQHTCQKVRIGGEV